MKTLFTLTFLLFCNLYLFAQAEKTLVQSIQLNGTVAVKAVFNGDVQVSEWDKDFIRITTNISLENSSELMLGRLVSVGRYTIEAKDESGELLLTMPKVAKTVNLKGTDLIERFTWKILVPKNTNIQTVATSKEKI